ncbi:MAG: OmcA/MtrC family decaheme c-type cytochrome, partial [Myxococcales bacterium]
EITYPQDLRNCVKCHTNASTKVTKAANWKDLPSRRACGACHDNISFAAGTAPNGRIKHAGGTQTNDATCSNSGNCHGPGADNEVAARHVAIAPPASDNTFNGGTNANTNAACVAAAGAVPTGAAKITYLVSSVALDASRHPQIVFKLQKDGADVTFSTAAGSELMTGFVGSPSAYFAWAVPQDGIVSPADFNASASAYIRSVANGTTPSSTATLTGPSTTGYYTLTIANVIISTSAKMLTGGIGYTYALNGTQPLTQIDLTGLSDSIKTTCAYSSTPNLNGQGGLIVPATDVWKVATNFSARRVTVDNAKCNACHDGLGVSPTFHAGQRNDGPTCSFCHTPNRTSSGWAAASDYFVHAIHGAAKRTEKFNWHSSTSTSGFYNVTYPGVLNRCETCHVTGGYDFSRLGSTVDALSSTILTTVAATTTAASISLSPYVTAGANYGVGFSYTATTQATVEAATSTLVISKFATACVSCHDSVTARAHMTANGGSFYEAREVAKGRVEQCTLCHAQGKVAGVAEVHSKK